MLTHLHTKHSFQNIFVHHLVFSNIPQLNAVSNLVHFFIFLLAINLCLCYSFLITPERVSALNNEFSIQLTGSTDLNFLIYIQNDYLNQKQKADLPKFPLLSDSVSYTETFEADFKETWEQLTNREHNLAQKEDITAEDLPLTELELRWFYDRLIDSSVPYEEFQFFYRAFSA